jgi:dihydropyrimidinase
VSCRDALGVIARARQQQRRVWAETCPQYLLLTAADMDRPGFEMAKFVCSPPLRSAADREALWEALATGALDLVASDHAPYRLNDPNGKLAKGAGAPFTEIPNGVPGLELRMPLLFSEGVVKGRFSASRFVALTSTVPARLYGMFPRKGTIAVGSDADLVVWDPGREADVTHAALHDAVDYTPYEGLRVTGWPVRTISQGEVVWDGHVVHGRPGRGRFIARAPLEP